MRPKNRLDAPPSKSGLGSLSAGAEAAGGDITDHAGPVGPRATLAVWASVISPAHFALVRNANFGEEIARRASRRPRHCVPAAGSTCPGETVATPAGRLSEVDAIAELP